MKRERNGDGLLLALIMDAVTGNLAVKLSVYRSPCYLKGLSQLQCAQYDGKIAMKIVINVIQSLIVQLMHNQFALKY